MLAKSLKKVIVCPMAAILPKIKSVLFRLLKRKDLAKIDSGPEIVHFADLVNNAGDPDPVTVDLDNDVAVLQYTGGTQADPKGQC